LQHDTAIMTAVAIVKHCGCGRCFGRRQWQSLPLVGYFTDGSIVVELWELRLCTCGTSLALVDTAHCMKADARGVMHVTTKRAHN
jgi:hypothetical protein